MLLELEAWLRTKNESAADSLLEAFEELLTVHRLKVPAWLRKTLLSTNPIESMFSLVRHTPRNPFLLYLGKKITALACFIASSVHFPSAWKIRLRVT